MGRGRGLGREYSVGPAGRQKCYSNLHGKPLAGGRCYAGASHLSAHCQTHPMTKKILIQDFILSKHNHATCVQQAVANAEAVCAARQERFTPLRKTVLELVWSSHKPVKAYDLLALLADVHERPAPPTVYRALDFLQEAGLVHKIQSLNAYVGCSDPKREHQAQFLICDGCGTIAELDDKSITDRIDQNARRVGFRVNDETVEVKGLCRDCQ